MPGCPRGSSERAARLRGLRLTSAVSGSRRADLPGTELREPQSPVGKNPQGTRQSGELAREEKALVMGQGWLCGPGPRPAAYRRLSGSTPEAGGGREETLNKNRVSFARNLWLTLLHFLPSSFPTRRGAETSFTLVALACGAQLGLHTCTLCRVPWGRQAPGFLRVLPKAAFFGGISIYRDPRGTQPF